MPNGIEFVEHMKLDPTKPSLLSWIFNREPYCCCQTDPACQHPQVMGRREATGLGQCLQI